GRGAGLPAGGARPPPRPRPPSLTLGGQDALGRVHLGGRLPLHRRQPAVPHPHRRAGERRRRRHRPPAERGPAGLTGRVLHPGPLPRGGQARHRAARPGGDRHRHLPGPGVRLPPGRRPIRNAPRHHGGADRAGKAGLLRVEHDPQHLRGRRHGGVADARPVARRVTPVRMVAWRSTMREGLMAERGGELPGGEIPRARPELHAVVPAADRYADWREVYDDNVVRIHRLMYGKVGNRPDAEDLTAEVFLAALGPLRLTVSRGEVRAYLLRTAATVLASFWRRRLGVEVTSIDLEAAAGVGAVGGGPGGAGL